MFTFTITPDHGEPLEVKAGSRDVYVWEQTGRDRSLKRFMEELKLGDAYAIAHIAARRLGLFTGTFEDFTSTFELDFEEADDEPDPTRPEASRSGS